MLVYVAELLLDYMARGPLRDPAGFNFPQSVTFDDAARLPYLMEGDTLHAGVAIALAASVLATLVLARTLFGFTVRVVGASPRAARFAGFSDARLTLAVFAVSGGAAGLAGICEVAGKIGQLQPSISPGYGFTAIIVAFLGRLSPVGILVAALVIALTTIGGEGAQIDLKLPLDLTRPSRACCWPWCWGPTPSRATGSASCRERRHDLPRHEPRHRPDGAGHHHRRRDPADDRGHRRTRGRARGVLNLGVEGMMVLGAATGFAVAVETGSTLLGAAAGAAAGLALSALFGLLTVGLSANQVASGSP